MCLLERQTDRQAGSWSEQEEKLSEEMLSWVGQEARPTQREIQQLPALTAGAGGEGHAIAVHLPHSPGVEGPGAPPHVHLEVQSPPERGRKRWRSRERKEERERGRERGRGRERKREREGKSNAWK